MQHALHIYLQRVSAKISFLWFLSSLKTSLDFSQRYAHTSCRHEHWFSISLLSSNFCFNATRYRGEKFDRRRLWRRAQKWGRISSIARIKRVEDRGKRSITRLHFRLCSTCNARKCREDVLLKWRGRRISKRTREIVGNYERRSKVNEVSYSSIALKPCLREPLLFFSFHCNRLSIYFFADDR